MAGAKLQFEIAAKLEKAGFKDAATHVKKIASETEKAGKAAKGSAKGTDLLKTAYTGLVGVGILAFFKSAIDAAMEAEESQAMLAQRIDTAGVSWNENRKKINAYTAALQDSTRFSQGEAEGALTNLIDQTNNVRQSQELLTLAMDLAIAKNIELGAAADIVGGAAQGVQGKLGQLAEMMGKDASEAKNAAEMLGMLEDRFGGMAQKEDTAAASMAKFKNASQSFREELGGFFLPLVTEVMDAIVKLGKTMDFVIAALVGGIIAFASAVTGDFSVAKAALVEAGDELEKAWIMLSQGPPKTDLKINLVDPTISAAKMMTAEMLALQIKLADETLAIQNNLILGQDELLLAAHESRVEKLRAMKDFEFLAEKDKLKLMAALNKRYQADVAAMEKAAMSRRILVAAQYANIVGTAVGNMLAGQKDSWKDATRAIVDMISQQAQAAVIANTIQGASKEFATKGIYGFVTAAPIIGWGLAQVGAIAAAAAAAKGAIGSGSGGTLSAPSASSGPGIGLGGGSGGGGGAAPAIAPASATETRVVNVNIYGDQYGETEFIERLGERLSAAVENADLRLVATQTNEVLS